jgi:hypothetical protein
VAKKKPSLSTVVAFMSDDTQARIETEDERPTSTLPLTSIFPDPNQPRQLLPTDLIEAVIANKITRIEALRRWIEQAATRDASPAQRRNVQELKRLADSIAQHGLISPISVRQPVPNEAISPNVEYMIVTGERRYWAHVYLLSQNRQIQEGDISVDPAQIKATLASTGITIRAHQLIENLLREDINAIERAQGMWALRYELSGVNYSSPLRQAQDTASTNIDAENDEVNYSSPQLVPWSRVEETLGISKRYRIFVTSVLNLCTGAQEIVKAHSLAEMTIRPIVQKLKDKPDLQVKALNQLIAWQAENESEDGPNRAIVASVKKFVDQLLAVEASKDTETKITRSVSSAPVVRFHKKVRQTLDFLGRLKADDKEGLTEALGRDEFTDIMIDLRNLRQQIDTIIETVTETYPPDDEMSPPDV